MGVPDSTSVQDAIRQAVAGEDLTQAAMEAVMRTIMDGAATPAQIGGLLIALRMKGETVDELTAATRVMRSFARKVDVSVPNLVDTAGTGGDGARTFNISTTAAVVAAAGGAHVAKHGNRSVSSSCGSADVLEAAGVNVSLEPEAIARCIEQVGIGFMFAPAHHGATRHAAGPRRELGIRTLFNMLGPLTNPAGAPNQVIGLYDGAWVERAVRALRELGSRHVLAFHADDGLDEISIGANTTVVELKNGDLHHYVLTPESFGMQRQPAEVLAVDSVQASLQRMREVLANKPGPARDIVCLNAGAALYVAGVSEDLPAGVDLAAATLASGAAADKLEAWAQLSQALVAAGN